MKKSEQQLSTIKTKVKLASENFDKLTYNFENKVPTVEEDLQSLIKKEGTSQNIQFFASDVGADKDSPVPSFGTADEYIKYFTDAKESMLENKIDPKFVTFDFFENAGYAAIKIMVFGDEKENKDIYVNRLKTQKNDLEEMKKQLMTVVENYKSIHEEYSQVSSDKSLAAAHKKLVQPYTEVIKEIDGLVEKHDEKLNLYQPPVKTKKMKR